MQPSSTMCRAQEARQQALALNSSLANVRQVAMLAAAAWAKEAKLAEKREERMLHRKADAQAAGLQVALPLSEDDDDEDLTFSENPDRGFPDAPAVRT